MRNLLIALTIASLGLPAAAHEGGAHVKGTITSVSTGLVTVKGADGHERTVSVTDKTEYVRGGAPATAAELKPGERVVIHTRKQGSGLEAVEVHLAAQKARLKH